jgi:general stress protein 26
MKTMTHATTQTTDTQLEMLRSKIVELQSALFFTESSSIVKLPTHVVSDVELDNEGQIWFVIPKPAMNIEAFEKEIPAKLDFFKKGKDFFVKVRGVAFLQTEQAEANCNVALSADFKQKMNNDEVIAVKVKIQDSELVDNTPQPRQNWLKASTSQLSSWFF